MRVPRYARLAAEVMRRGEPPVSALPWRSNRDEEIALIEQAMDHKRRQSTRWRWAVVGAAAAALVLGGMGRWRGAHEKPGAPSTAGLQDSTGQGSVALPVAIAISSGSGAVVTAPGSSTPAVTGGVLQAGSRIIVGPSAGARLSLSTGTHLEVERGSQLSVVEDSRAQIFALNAGSLRADVAKLAKDERFIVRTTDTEIEVRGTSFAVNVVGADPACGEGVTTRVTVFEGVVAVRASGREESVGPGETWPRGCRQPTALVPSPIIARKPVARIESSHHELSTVPSSPPPASSPPASSLPESPGPSAPPSGPPGSPPQRPSSQVAAPSNLAAENDLFAEGMLARRSGNLPLAVEKMQRLLEKHPSSHLAENAAAERMRLLRTLDRAKGVAAARRYLQTYPNGFARADAEAIISGTR